MELGQGAVVDGRIHTPCSHGADGTATDAGELVFKQIAGLIARRVVSWKKAGDAVARGERIGLVRFGSRVDLWVPREAEIVVKVGENVKGGSSILANWLVRGDNVAGRRMATGVNPVTVGKQS